MTNVLEMKDLMNLQLFEKITHISTIDTFNYNNAVFFCVPKSQVAKAIGKSAINAKKISAITKKRIKIIAKPNGEKDAKSFIESIISPVTFTDLEIKNKEIILTAGSANKAALLGREKRRLKEMENIIKDQFSLGFKII